MEQTNSAKSPKKFDFKELLFFFKNSFLATQNTIGIDVGQGYIKIVQLQKARKGYILTDYRVRALPSKIKDNPREKNKFVKEFITEYVSQSRIKTSLGRLAIKGTGVFTFSILLPPLSAKDLKGTVGIELKKRLPFQLDFQNIFFNYFITEKFEEETPQIMVTCIAVENSIIDKHLEFLKSFNLRPVTINTSADALGNIIGVIGEGQYVAVLDMGVKESVLSFYKGILLQFNREIPIGGQQFTQAVLKALSPLGENITLEDAESFKRQCGIPMHEETDAEFYTDFGAIKGSQITGALRPILERLITELSRTITFYFRTYKIDTLDAVYITGGASRLKNIDKFLSENLSNLSIKKLEKLDPLKAIKGWVDVGALREGMVMEEAAPHLASALGICINDGGEVNFVPPKEKIEQKALFVMFLARLIFPLFFLAVSIFYTINWLLVFKYKTLASQRENNIKEREATINKINEYLSLKKNLEERESLLQMAIGKQPFWYGIFKEISNITPEEITLYSIEIKTEETPKKLVLTGEVISDYATPPDLILSQYQSNLEDSPFFVKVNYSSERDNYSPIPKAAFELKCDLKI